MRLHERVRLPHSPTAKGTASTDFKWLIAIAVAHAGASKL